MTRFYGKGVSDDDTPSVFFITVTCNSRHIDVEVTEELFDELDDMQREYWRLERKEARHTKHIEMMSDSDLPHSRYTKDPEQLLIEQIEATEIRSALRQISDIQQKRFLLHHLIGLPIRCISEMDGCSERAVKYSLALARKKLRKILSE